LAEINEFFQTKVYTKEFQDKLLEYYKNYVGRFSAIYFAKNISKKGAKIYLKREDLIMLVYIKLIIVWVKC
jgi:tryptophan synthase beta chain